MDDTRPEALAARVVAWHNRHPLARRITAAQVTSVGLVALPFVARASNIAPAALLDLPTLALADAAVPNGLHRAHATLREKARAQTAHGADAAQARTGGAVPTQASAPPKPGNTLQRLRGWFNLRAARRRAQTLARDRAQARAQALRMAFSEDFIAPLTPKRVAQWALRHGRLLGLMPEQHPVRTVQTDASLAADARATTLLFLATAAIEITPPGADPATAARRCRVLLGDGHQPLGLGPRHYSPQRLGAAMAGLMLVVGLGTMAPFMTRGPGAPDGAVVASAKPNAAAASAPTLAPQRAPAPALADVVPDIAVVATETAAAAATAASGSGSADAVAVAVAATPENETVAASELKSGLPAPATPVARSEDSAGRELATAGPPPRQSTVPAVRTPLDEASKAAARQAVADARAARGDGLQQAPGAPASPSGLATAGAQTAAAAAAPALSPAPAPAPTPAPTPAPAATALAATAIAPIAAPARAATTPAPATAPRPVVAATPTYALSTRLLRTRAESEQVIVAWRALLEGTQKEPVKVALMAAGDDWRVVSWPFARREDAERARALLAARGLRAETVDF